MSQPPCVFVRSVQRSLGGVVFRDRRARFHGGDDDAVVHDAELRHVRGLGEELLRGLTIADMPVEDDVVMAFVPHLGLVRLHRVLEIGDRRQDVVFDRHGLRAVARGLRALGDDEGDGVADMAHMPVREHRVRHVHRGRAVAVLELHRAAQRADAVGLEIVRGIDPEHAGHRLRRLGVDRDDLRGRVRAPQHDAGGGAGQGDVVRIAAVPLEQARILDAADRLGETELGGHEHFFPG